MAVDNLMFLHQASFLTSLIEHNKIAKIYINHNDVKPIQILHDADEAFIEQIPLMNEDFISTLWNLRQNTEKSYQASTLISSKVSTQRKLLNAISGQL